jgi:hypothetical protein
MADSDYTVAVVLQASDEGMSTTLKKTAQGITEVDKKAQSAQISFMSMMVGLEGLTSGLNQLTGGMRKMTAAMSQTGLATEEQTEKLNKQIAMVELFTGPMESLIAIVKLTTVVQALYTGIKGIDIGVTIAATFANWGFAASLIAVNIAAVGFIAIVGLALLLLIDTEKGLEVVNAGLDATAGAIQAVNEGVRTLIDLAVSGGQAVGDFFGNIQGPGGSLAVGDGTTIHMGGGRLA